MMTNEDLNAIKERCEKATEGPWVEGRHWCKEDTRWPGYIIKGICEDDFDADGPENEILEMSVCDITAKKGEEGYFNAAFIAHARADIPALITEVERLQVQLAL